MLVVASDPSLRDELGAGLAALGCSVTAWSDAARSSPCDTVTPFDLAFLELAADAPNTPDPLARCLNMLPSLRSANARLEAVIVSAAATVAQAIGAIERGADGYLPRPFTAAQLRRLVERTASHIELLGQVDDLRTQLSQSAPEVDLETRSPRLRALLRVLGAAAEHDVPVLLRGESGSGRSVLARRLHALSGRRAHPFVVVHGGPVPEEELRATLFGGSAERPGAVEAAARGTLFLDEVAGLPAAIQAELARLLRDGEFVRPGSDRVLRAEVRVVAATRTDPRLEVAAGRLQKDLLSLLDTVEIEVPALRQRSEDIVPLARRFLAFYGRLSSCAPLDLTPAACAVLTAWEWPGNVRELRNTVEAAVLRAVTSRVGPDQLPERMVTRVRAVPVVGGDFTLEEVEREHTLRVLSRSRSLDEAAAVLGIDPQELWQRRRTWQDR